MLVKGPPLRSRRAKRKSKIEPNPHLPWVARGEVIIHTLKVLASLPGQLGLSLPRPDSGACQQTPHVSQERPTSSTEEVGGGGRWPPRFSAPQICHALSLLAAFGHAVLPAWNFTMQGIHLLQDTAYRTPWPSHLSLPDDPIRGECPRHCASPCPASILYGSAAHGSFTQFLC